MSGKKKKGKATEKREGKGEGDGKAVGVDKGEGDIGDVGVFIFRRDLRLEDNVGLTLLLEKTRRIIPLFVFTPEQIGKGNRYKSDNAIGFMVESLQDLEKEITKSSKGGKGGKGGKGINYALSTNLEAVSNLIRDGVHGEKIRYLGFNLDWTPYAKKRDAEIIHLCKSNNIEVITGEDYTLHPMGTLRKSDQSVFKVYGPFRKNAEKLESQIPKPVKFNPRGITWIYPFTISNVVDPSLGLSSYYTDSPERLCHASREVALAILKDIKSSQSSYSSSRDSLVYQTTHLSSYLKFGNVSIREAYHSFKAGLERSNGLFNQLYWKEFYVYIGHYLPHVLEGQSMKPEYDKITWTNNTRIFEAWCKGMTGFPIVDAGMRELNATGYMHNRSRLITSGFLVKLAIVNWKKGERYFAQKLTDYDPAQNNGGWQWSSGSGADSQPYFRILSPISQATKFDPEAAYIKKWCPELKDVPPRHLHDWEKYNSQYPKIDYPCPCLDYKRARATVMAVYKKGLGRE